MAAKIINYHSSGSSAPQASNLELGELAVVHNDSEPRIYTKKNGGELAEFVDKSYIDNIVGDIHTILEEVLYTKI